MALYHTLGISRCYNKLFISHLSFFIGLIRDRFVSYVNSLMGKKTFMRTTAAAEGQGLDPVNIILGSPVPSNLYLTVPRRYVCCGSSMLHVVMSVYI